MPETPRQEEGAEKNAMSLDRPSSWADRLHPSRAPAVDLRSIAPSADRDRSAHRRWAWFYEDLLN